MSSSNSSSSDEREHLNAVHSEPEGTQAEQARLRALRRYEVVGTEPEPSFDRITRVTASLFEVPIALINFVAEGQQWRKSAVGVESGEQDLRPSFCLEAIQSGGTTVIEDVARTERFSDHPLVESPPGARFYAGAPLRTPDGYRIGTLCVLDTTPRSFSDEEASRLEDLAEMVMSELELRRETQEKLREKDRRLQSIAENVSEGIYRSTPEGELVHANQAFAEMFGYDSVGEVLEATPEELYADPVRREEVLEKTDEQGGLDGEVIEFRRADGSTFTGRVSDTVVRGEDGEVAYYDGVVADVTEQRRREEELRRQKNLLEQTQKLAGAWEADLETGEVSWSDKVYEIHEVDPEAPMDLEKGLSFYTPEAREKIQEATDALVEDGRAYDLELPIDTAKGNRRWVRTVGALAETSGEEDTKVTGSFQNITEQKRQERALERQNDLFRRAQEIANVGAWEYDVRAGEGTMTEQAYCIYGLSPDTDKTYQWTLSLYHPEDQPAIRTAFGRAVEEGEPYDLELRLTTETGERKWVRVRGEPQYGEEGDLAQVRGTIQDITERKRREQELQKSKRRFEALFNDPNILAGLLDKDGRLLGANQTALGYIAEDLEEIAGEPFWETPWWTDQMREAIREKVLEAAGGEYVDYEANHIRPDGTVHVVNGVIRPVTDGTGDVVSLFVTARDVTERKRREKELKETSATLEAILENLPPGVLAEDGDRDIVAVNQGLCDVLGLSASPEDLKGSSWAEATQEVARQFEEPGRFADRVEELLEEGKPVEREELRLADGRVLERDFVPYTLAGEEAALWLYRDVTERKRKEQELRESRRELREEKRRIRAITENVSDGIYRSTEEEGIVYANQAFIGMFGYRDLEELKAAGSEALYADPSRREELFKKEAEEGELGREEVRFRRKDGTTFIGLLNTQQVEAQQVEGEDRGKTYFDGAITDITERKRHERNLKRRREDIEALYEATRGLLRAESKGGIYDRIHAVLRSVFDYDLVYTGVREGGVIRPARTDRSGDMEVPPPNLHPTGGDSIANQVLQDRETVVIRDVEDLENDIDYGDLGSAAGVPIGERGVIIVGHAGRNSFDRFNLRLIEVLAGYASLVLGRLGREDRLREAKEEAEEARREAEQARREAEEANQMKSAFLANMSHEIRTPLTSIIGFAEALGTEVAGLNLPEGSSLPDYAGLIEKGGRRLLKTLEGVLNLSKLEAGQMELSKKPVSLTAEAQRTAEELRPEAEEKQIDLRIQAERAWAIADEGGVQIVMRNLLSNSIKYTGENGTIWVRIYQEEDRAVLEVEDTGIGMEPGLAEDLFEPFRQASEGLAREYEGTGVGLAVTKKATEQMNGSVTVDTEKGEGTRFTVRLPAAEEEPPNGKGVDGEGPEK